MKIPTKALYCSLLILIGCSNENNQTDIVLPPADSTPILVQLSQNYDLLPEEAISINEDHRVYAQYINPTERYIHRVMGDSVEGAGLMIVMDSIFYELNLPDNYVFEDIRPRLFDVDQDGKLEVITIRTEVSNGAGIAIYKVIENELKEYAFVPEIGLSNRWLNIVAMNDLDEDGTVELVWIQTPHIGGILKVAKIEAGEMTVLDEKSEYSNHGYGDRNLCLSVLAQEDQEKIIYVPSQDRTKIVGFKYRDNALEMVTEIEKTIDFSKILSEQYNFSNIILDEVNCIFVN